MKTAIEQIEEYVSELKQKYDFSFYKFFEKVKELKETEKQQIIDSVTHGNRMEFYDATETAGEQYYNDTFTTNKETLK